MGKKDIVTRDDDARIKLAGRAFAMRLEGESVDSIALELDLAPLDVEGLVRIAFGRLSVQSADEARAEVEGRLDILVKRVNRDIVLAQSQSERTALYRIVLAIERDRATLLGLDIPKGTPDAEPPTNDN